MEGLLLPCLLQLPMDQAGSSPWDSTLPWDCGGRSSPDSRSSCRTLAAASFSLLWLHIPQDEGGRRVGFGDLQD